LTDSHAAVGATIRVSGRQPRCLGVVQDISRLGQQAAAGIGERHAPLAAVKQPQASSCPGFRICSLTAGWATCRRSAARRSLVECGKLALGLAQSHLCGAWQAL
jgi:hypothetical protein